MTLIVQVINLKECSMKEVFDERSDARRKTKDGLVIMCSCHKVVDILWSQETSIAEPHGKMLSGNPLTEWRKAVSSDDSMKDALHMMASNIRPKGLAVPTLEVVPL